MANETQSKKGPGRPAGSRSKNGGQTGMPVTRQERIDQMQADYDRERRNVDVIWSITLIAVSLFLFFTVVMDSTGTLGSKVHDICLGLFGLMAYVLPFLVLVSAILLLARKLQHFSTRTSVFSVLMFLNMCILNSYRFIDETNLAFGFDDIAQFYADGVSGDGGGVLGMEIGSIMVNLLGKPGLLIVAGAMLIISIFLVANTPISRFFENLSRKREAKLILSEMEEAEAAKVQTAVAATATVGADPETGIVAGGVRAADMQDTLVIREKEGRSIWKSILNGIIKGDDDEDDYDDIDPVSAGAGGTDKVVSRQSPAAGAAADPYVMPRIRTPEPVRRPAAVSDTFIDEMPRLTDEKPSGNKGLDDRTLPPQKDDSVMQAVSRDTLFGKLKKRFTASQPAVSYDDDDGDYGYPGRRIDQKPQTEKPSVSGSEEKHYGLEDPAGTGAGSGYGLGGGVTSHRGLGLVDEPAASPSAAPGRINGLPDEKTARSQASRPEQTDFDEAVNRRKAASAAAALRVSDAPAGTSSSSKKKADEGRTEEDEALANSFSAQSVDTAYELPSVNLLKKGTANKQVASDYQLEQKADLLEKTLNDFGVDARVIKVTQGASVTRYEVQPATGVKVSSITRLADDIALNLRAKNLRIEAPIPGKAAVGIEVENDKPSPVLIRELIESEEFANAKSKITFAVGKDISGNNIVADLKSMPHLLIAGATGSGKSVCVNTIITSFLYKAKPSELKLIMIDPKVVELANYNGIPHMLTPVVTDARKAARALAIAVEEMDKRYELFAKEGVKDLESYNELMRANHEPQNCKPQVVIIIDELADLMMASPSEVENSICRLAQKARAAGMHLIVATQRPSVDVVTGLIKANIPSRIAFSVASQFDSRTILDMAGAEKLLGKGDMLFSPVGSNKPFRVQGPYISDSEIEKVIRSVKKEGGDPVYDEELRSAIDNADKKSQSGPADELTEDAIAFILKSRQASVSMLQRRFRIGYNRAARIIDEIEEKGIIGPSDGSRPRQVLITEDEYYGGGAEEEVAQAPAEPQQVRQEPAAPRAHTEPEEHHRHEAADTPEESVSIEEVESAVDYFRSLPESVQKMILNSDGKFRD